MKKMLLLVFITLSVSMLFTERLEDSCNWSEHKISVKTENDVYRLLNGSRAEGDISFGNEYVYNEGTSNYNVVARLDATHIVSVFSDWGDGRKGKAVIGTVSGNTITYGSKYTFETDYAYFNEVTALDESHFIVVYLDDLSGDYGAAIMGTVSGNTISFGSPFVFNTAQTRDLSITSVDDSHFIIVYRDSNNYGRAIHGTVSGNDLLFGAEYTYNPGSTRYNTVSMLDASHFVIIYRDDGNSEYPTNIIGTISGNSLSFGDEYVPNDANSYALSVAALDANHFVAVYRDGSVPAYGTAVIGTVTGDNISYGTQYYYNEANTTSATVTKFDSSHFVISYVDYDNSQYGECIIGSVSGNNINFGSEFVYNPATTSGTHAAVLTSSSFVICYADDGNSEYGTMIIGEREDSPTSYVLSSFTAVYTNGSSLLEWTTQSESDNLGWNIYRSRSDLETTVRINGHLIGGAGTTTGPTDYEFNDEDDLTVNTTYYYWLESLNYDGESEYFGPISLFVPEPGNDPDAPDTVIYDLRNSPNPFYPETTISFSLSEPARIKVTVYNIKGQEVIRLFNGFCSEDNFSVSWNGKDSSGSDVTSGIYYYKLQTQGYSKINKMILMK